MKKYILLLCAVAWLSACRDSEDSNIPSTDEDINPPSALNLPEGDVIKGFLRIKLKEEPKKPIIIRNTDGKISTGIRALDGSAAILKINRMERTFPYTEKYEKRTRKEGLHLWYNVWYAENDITTTRAANEIKILDDVEMAYPVRKIKTRANALPWNDPDLGRQWSLRNLGNESWQTAGADIRLANVWKQYNGDPNIIVGVVDEGIDVNHPDLAGNLWTNKEEIPGNGIDDDGNGYIDDIHGFNFVQDSPVITPYDHGTHVAGIIAAVTNNGIGISGIAGGNGMPNSGVKIMCCQNIEGLKDVGGAKAIKYAADNGAVICQNSWGYTGTIDPADKAVIDYFIKYAGCDNEGNQLPTSPMKGGIVLFATNNHNTSDPSDATPADYEKVIGIAALAADYQKASYSNYGDYIDICAPGGEKKKGNEFRSIYSTSKNSSYLYMHGASMACPHVSGVVALVIEKHGVGKQGFTAGQLEEILLSTAYDISTYNPQYIGQLGSGCVNAAAALEAGLPSPEPFLLKSNPVTNGTLLFSASREWAGNATITIYNSTGHKVLGKSVTVRQYATVSLDIQKLAAGYYTMHYACNGNSIKEKFIKY